MSSIGTLNSGSSKTFDLNYLPQTIQIGSVADAVNFSSLQVQASGKALITLSDADQIACLLKLETDGSFAGLSSQILNKLVLTDGRVAATSTITIENVDLTTPSVYQLSIGAGSSVRYVAVSPVVANGSNNYSNFDVLFMKPANFLRATITFDNGWTEDVNADELAGLYALNNNTEASGLVNGFLVIQGQRAENGFGISSLVIYATGSNLDVVVSRWGKL
jgi:hypothetical protein